MVVKFGRKVQLAPAQGNIPAREVEELELKLDALTGADVEFALREAMASERSVVQLPVYDVRFQAQLAARACGEEVATLQRLPAAAYLLVTMAVQGFLLEWA